MKLTREKRKINLLSDYFNMLKTQNEMKWIAIKQKKINRCNKTIKTKWIYDGIYDGIWWNRCHTEMGKQEIMDRNSGS